MIEVLLKRRIAERSRGVRLIVMLIATKKMNSQGHLSSTIIISVAFSRQIVNNLRERILMR